MGCHTPLGLLPVGWGLVFTVMAGEHFGEHVRFKEGMGFRPDRCRKCIRLISSLTDLSRIQAAEIADLILSWASGDDSEEALSRLGDCPVIYQVAPRRALVSLDTGGDNGAGRGRRWAVDKALEGSPVAAVFYESGRKGGEWRRVVYLGSWPPDELGRSDVEGLPSVTDWEEMSPPERREAAALYGAEEGT